MMSRLVAEVADYIYVMNKGQFVAQGSVEEIFLQPDMLRSVRLDVPVLPKLIRSSRTKGMPVPMAYTYEDAEAGARSTPTRGTNGTGSAMTMIEELFYIEKSAYRDSFIHRLDARVKILGAFALIIAMVAVPYSPLVFTVGHYFSCFFAMLWGALPACPGRLLQNASAWSCRSGSSSSSSRSSSPTGITPSSMSSPTCRSASISTRSPLSLPLILLVKFIVCVSAIILLSSTTKLQDMLEGAGRMGFPPSLPSRSA